MLRLATLKTILRKKRSNNSSKPQQKSNYRVPQVAEYQAGDRLKEGTRVLILLSVQQKVKKSEALHINKDSSPLSVLMLFFTDIFHMPVEQKNV